MTVFVSMLIAGAVTYVFYQQTRKKEVFILIVVLFSILILSPTLKWSYLFDDIDNFYIISRTTNASDVLSYIMIPGDGHFIPATRLFYFLCFKIWWINSVPFHVLMLVAFAVSGVIFIKIIERITHSFSAAIFGGILFMFSTSYLRNMETTFGLHLLTLPFILGALYFIIRYEETKYFVWSVLSGLSILISLFISSFSLLSGLWVILFLILCMPNIRKIGKMQNVYCVIFPLFCWIIGLALFILMVKPLEHSSQIYFYIIRAVFLTVKSLCLYTLPLVTPWEKASMFMAVFFGIMAIVKRNEISWRPIIFFFLWAIGYYMLIYVGRGELGDMLISTQRYHFYPSLSMPAVYSIILASIIKDPYWTRFKKRDAVNIVFIVLIILFAYHQYGLVVKNSENRPSFYALGLELRNSMQEYLAQSNKKKLVLDNRKVWLYKIYYRKRKFKRYANIFLPPELYKKIEWKNFTDKDYLDFIQTRKNDYSRLIAVFKTGGYIQ